MANRRTITKKQLHQVLKSRSETRAYVVAMLKPGSIGSVSGFDIYISNHPPARVWAKSRRTA